MLIIGILDNAEHAQTVTTRIGMVLAGALLAGVNSTAKITGESPARTIC